MKAIIFGNVHFMVGQISRRCKMQYSSYLDAWDALDEVRWYVGKMYSWDVDYGVVFDDKLGSWRVVPVF
jgi:hypothetical protein